MAVALEYPLLHVLTALSPLFNIILSTGPVEPLLCFTEHLLDFQMTSSAIIMQEFVFVYVHILSS